MDNLLRPNLDQHQLDRLEALLLLYQETFPNRPMNRKELLNRAVNEGLQSLLAELLATSKRCDIGGRKHGKRWVAA